MERRRSTAPKVTKITKEEPVVTKVSDRKEEKESPTAVVENAPVPSDSAPPAAAQPEREVKQEKAVEELSVR